MRRRAMVWCVPALVVAVTLAAALSGPVGAGRADRGGALDPTFGTDGRVVVDLGGEFFQHDAATDLAEQADGRLVVAGTTGPDFAQDVVVARFDPAGRLDATFGDDGWVRTDFGGDSFDVDSGSSVAVQRDGKIVVAGGGSSTRPRRASAWSGTTATARSTPASAGTAPW